MPVGTVKNGQIIGFKYFGFGGLKTVQKGLKPFEGTKKGNKTTLNLFLTPKTNQAFKINVWLDGPWPNKVWKGKKIGEINVPAGSAQELTRFKLDVAKYVDGLGKKHAIYLVAEGAEGEGLFELMGLGFSSKNKDIEGPVVPQMRFKANGQWLETPAYPVRSTNQNGLIDNTLYEVKVPVTGSVWPVVEVTSTHPEVKISMTTRDGSIAYDCDYKGMVKTYKLVFEKK
jgi:hypothetical protein